MDFSNSLNTIGNHISFAVYTSTFNIYWAIPRDNFDIVSIQKYIFC